MPADPRTKRRLGTGVRRDSCGIEAYLNVHGRRYGHRFPHKTPLKHVQQWREDTRLRVLSGDEVLPLLPRTGSGWCYVYAAADNSGRVKIGKSLNALARVRNLSQGEQLTILAQIPAHAAIERAIHRRFAHLALGNEWFRLDDTLHEFMARLAKGDNPIALLWDATSR